MAFNPTPINFNYKQYLPTFTQSVLYDPSGDFTSDSIVDLQLINMPPWLQYENLIWLSSENKISFILRIKESYAFTMAEGNYLKNIQVKGKRLIGSGPFYVTFTTGNLPVTLQVQHTVLLTVSPTTLPFGTYIIGNPAPQNKTMQLQSEGNWSITNGQSWVTLSQTNGFGNATIIVGVNPAGLTVGQYEAILVIQDQIFTKQVVVTLTVTEGDTDEDYIYVSPNSLQFISELGEDNTTEKTVSIEASESWTAEASEDWLVLSASSGSSGVSTITVTVDSDELTDLDVSYLAQIVFTAGSIQKIVYVELILVEFFITGIESDTLYFADDRNKVTASNTSSNMFLVLDAVASNGQTNQPYQIEAPYRNGIASAVLGKEANVLLKSVVPTNSFTSRVQHTINPITVNFSAFNKNKFNDTLSVIASFQNVKFLTGKTPTVANKICYTPSVLHVSKNAVLSLSVLATSAPTDIEITGDVTQTISTSISNDVLTYNAIINLAPMNLVAGNTINIVWADLDIDVIIVETPAESTRLAFENEWREYEFFECRGTISITPEGTQTTTQLQVEGEKHTKVVAIDKGVDYTINTGYLYTQAEVDWLERMLYAKRKFIYIDDQPIEIIMETKSIETYKTREYTKGYPLKFRKAIV